MAGQTVVHAQMIECPLITQVIVICKDFTSVCMDMIAFQDTVAPIVLMVKFALLVKLIKIAWISQLTAV